ncbi:MAG TPA: DUF6265 family protein [Sediminibacterium sp.]|nr:DUF6265 family protein [Sediminibacterium sp.]
MKKTLKVIIVILSSFVFVMCNTNQHESKKTIQDKENFDWLLGNWKRTNEAKGKETFENWVKINDSEYSGIGFTLQNNDTSSQELMKLLEINGKWNLLVKVPEEKDFITFKMSEIKNNQFECKNDSLNFPKCIKYWKSGNKMNAIVSGDSLKLSFEFEQVK